jgi:WhiB family transcriptional regulator, redox-sensing transcriptional regulator
MLGQNKASAKLYIKLLSEIRANGGVECEQVPHVFFPDDSLGLGEMFHREKKLALDICSRCPVKYTCAEYALTAREPYGIWGGTSPSDR